MNEFIQSFTLPHSLTFCFYNPVLNVYYFLSENDNNWFCFSEELDFYGAFSHFFFFTHF